MSNISPKNLLKEARAKRHKQPKKPDLIKAFAPAVGFGAGAAFGKTILAKQTEGLFHKVLGLGKKGIKYGDTKAIDDALKTIFETKNYKGISGSAKKALWSTYAHAPSGLARAFSAGILGIPLAYGGALAARELNK